MLIINLVVLFISAYLLGLVFKKFQLPALLAYLIIGMLAGESFLSLVPESEKAFTPLRIDENIQSQSSLLKNLALWIILLRAGLSFKWKTLQKIGRCASLMSCIPFLAEALIIFFLGRHFFLFSVIEAALLATTLAAVSPAVIIPQMLLLKEKGIGEKKDAPSLVLASAAIDDILSLTAFWSVIAFALNSNKELSLSQQIIHFPLSLISAIIIAFIVGLATLKILPLLKNKLLLQNLSLLLIAALFFGLETLQLFPFASILAIIVLGFVISEKNHHLGEKLSHAFKHFWFLGEMILFILIGSEVRIELIPECGFFALAILFLGLFARSAGVCFSLLKSQYNFKERLFCIFAFWPKATVQAAVGGVALSLVKDNKLELAGGSDNAQLILAIAVLSIIISAPLGSIIISLSAEKLLKEEPPQSEG